MRHKARNGQVGHNGTGKSYYRFSHVYVMLLCWDWLLETVPFCPLEGIEYVPIFSE
jgi:hypothetical protein